MISAAEIAKLVVTRAQFYLWDRHKCETILKLVISALELPPPGAVKGKNKGNLKPVCNHEWENPQSRFLKCVKCDFLTVRVVEPFDTTSTPPPSRMTQTDPASLVRNSSRVPTVNTRKLKQRLPS